MAQIKFDIDTCRKILKDEFRKISPTEDDLLNELVSLFVLESYKPKSIISQPENTSRRLFFIIKGLVRDYYIIDGKEIVADFTEENKLFANIYSIITGIPNINYFEALEETVCLVAEFSELESLFHKHHALDRLARKLVETYYSRFLIENYNKLFLSSEDRFAIFLKERPALLNRVSLKLIASYLSITPETLSRLRAKR